MERRPEREANSAEPEAGAERLAAFGGKATWRGNAAENDARAIVPMKRWAAPEIRMDRAAP